MKDISDSDLQCPQKKWGGLPVLGRRPRTDESLRLKTDLMGARPPHFFKVPSRDRWNPANFGEMPRKLNSDGNPLIFWDDSIEPPEPDDYDTLAEYEEAWEKWEKEYSDSLTCAAELEPVSPSLELSQEKFNYADSVKIL